MPEDRRSSTSTSTPSTRSSTGRAGSRRSRPGPPSSRCRPSGSPTTARSPARSSSTGRPEKVGVKPVLGCEVYVSDDRRAQTKGNAHLTLLAEDNAGYSNLIKLASAGYLEGYYYKPRVDWELLQRHSHGLIALSGCLSGRVCKALEEGRAADADGRAGPARPDLRQGLVYVEMQNAHLERAAANQPAPREAGRAAPGCRLVATGDVHYLRHEDARAHEALLCIQSGDSLKNPKHWKFDTDHFYFKSPEEMALDFPGYDHALRRTLEVAERCNVDDRARRDPAAEVPDARRARRFDYLVELSERGLEKRYDKITAELSERLKFELKTIREMGFADYFLIVWDFIAFAKRNGISVGPGRGSAAGSLVAYCLEITDIDPIRYDLLFERFLNPGRKSMPDMDIDFAVEGRDRVINYVAEKYGRDRVAQIITFWTMAARAAVRDAGRVLEVPYGVVDKIAKLIPEGPGPDARRLPQAGQPSWQAHTTPTRSRARSSTSRGRSKGLSAPGLDPRRRRRHRRRAADERRPAAAEGRRPGSRHAVRDGRRRGARPAEDGLPRPAQPRRDRQGRARSSATGSTSATIPLDDKKTYAMLARGEATGVFQFESSGMREALRQVKPTVFEDLIALVALYRPGPMAVHPRLRAPQERPGARHVHRPAPEADHRARRTASAIYQEQYMEIAKQLAGFSPAEADDLRKAIGKKIHSLMASLKEKFLEGCAQNGVAAGVAQAALGGHRAGAGLLLQQVARRLLRADRLPHRLAAREPPARVHGGAHLLRHEHEGQVPFYVNACDELGIEVLPPDVNDVAARLRRRRGEDPLRAQRREERRRVRVPRDRPRRARRAGRSRRSGTSPSASTRRSSNKRALESLVKCGALDSTGASRQGDARGARAGALARGSGQQADRLLGQGSIFDLGEPPAATRETTRRSPREEFEKSELLRLEKESLGLYVSEHPLARDPRPAAAQDRLRARRARAAPRRRDRHRRRHRLRAASS